MNPPVFSIALIARNEARNLPRLFASLAEYSASGGEITIVDTGSDDDTISSARKLGARVVEMPGKFDLFLSASQAARIEETFARNGETLNLEIGQRIFHMGKARDFATSQASRDFVFMPDAGDELLALDVDWLNAQLQDGRASGFSYRLQYGAATLVQSRFYDRRIRQWRGAIHEALFDRDGVLCSQVLPEQAPILRASKNHLWLRHYRGQKIRNYMAGMALDSLEDPENSRWQHYLGREFFYFGKWHSAIALLEKHAANSNAWILEQNESCCLIGRCREELGELDAAQNAYLRALELTDSRREPLLRLAQMATRRGDFQSCAEYSRAAMQIKSVGDFSEADTNYAQLPHALLYWSLFWLGEGEAAEMHWRKCLAFEPQNAKFLNDAKLFGADLNGVLHPPPITLHILTRCSRAEHLLKIKNSIFDGESGFEIIWHLLFDRAILPEIDAELNDELLEQLNQPNIEKSFFKSIPGDMAHAALNAALDEISDGWVYVLDDDNALHENFYRHISALISNQKWRGIIFSQQIDGRDFTGQQIREAKPENTKVQKIDMAQFLLCRDLIGNHRFDFGDYLADGHFIEEIFQCHADEFVFSEEVLCYYNYFSDHHKAKK